MLSYRHGYHAGNHADVFKHIVLSLLVRSLLTKEKPFFYLDTHAGAGRYHLESTLPSKNREFESGIASLMNHGDAPPELSDYFAAIAVLNHGGGFLDYPGSPCIVRSMLRSGDRMSLCELHPRDLEALQWVFSGERRVCVSQMDGYQAIRAQLPPLERRGLVHIDPAYELKDERKRLLEALREGHRRWATGMYAVWYPIQDRYVADDFLKRVQRSRIPRILMSEFSVLQQTEELRMIGSGMLVINPPWKLEEQLRGVLPWLWERLAVKGQGGYRVKWLVEEANR